PWFRAWLVRKSEIRILKSERNPKPEVRNCPPGRPAFSFDPKRGPKQHCWKLIRNSSRLAGFRHSDFEFRHSHRLEASQQFLRRRRGGADFAHDDARRV